MHLTDGGAYSSLKGGSRCGTMSWLSGMAVQCCDVGLYPMLERM